MTLSGQPRRRGCPSGRRKGPSSPRASLPGTTPPLPTATRGPSRGAMSAPWLPPVRTSQASPPDGSPIRTGHPWTASGPTPPWSTAGMSSPRTPPGCTASSRVSISSSRSLRRTAGRGATALGPAAAGSTCWPWRRSRGSGPCRWLCALTARRTSSCRDSRTGCASA